MPITSATAQLRTTDPHASIRVYTEVPGLRLAFRYRDRYAGMRAGTHDAAALAQTLAGRGVGQDLAP